MKKHLILSALLTLLLGQQVQAIAFMGIEAHPSSPNAEIPNYFIYENRAGQTVEDTLTIENNTEETTKIKIYAVETGLNNQGQETLQPYNVEKKNLANWITFNNENEVNLELVPHQPQEIKFSINIPADALKQEYKGGIMVERANVKEAQTEDYVNIQTNGRVGIKTFLTVTDNPREIPKLSTIQSPTPWTQIYFYVSLGLFIVVIGAFGVNALRKKRKHHKK